MRIHHSDIRGILLFLACLTLPATPWRVIIPLPEHGLLAGRGKIEESDIAFLKVGVTTRGEVLLRFGEPDGVLLDQRILAYSWAVSVGVVAVGSGGGDIWKYYLFMVEFDEEGRLKREEINSNRTWQNLEAMLEEWIKQSENENIRGKPCKD